MERMKRNIIKQYRGGVDIKDYDRQECIDDKKGLEITHAGRVMTLDLRQVKNKPFAKSDKKFKGKEVDNYRDYYIYSYKWNPDNTKTTEDE